MEFNPKIESCKISTDHMTRLAIQNRDFNHQEFVGHMTIPQYIAPPTEDQEIKKEFEILQGLSITNKNCYWKKPEYNAGPWEKQFTPYVGEIQFNVQTKRKVSK